MADEPIEEPEQAPSRRSKIISSVVFGLVVLGAVWLLFRMTSPAIAPGRMPPATHYPLPCPTCHVISADAPVPAQ